MSIDNNTSRVPIIADGMTLGVIGAGVMGRTLVRGILASGVVAKDSLWAGDKNTAACAEAAEELGIPVESNYAARVPGAGLILLCVKPNDAPGRKSGD